MTTLIECHGAARTYGTGSTATVALEPCDCVVREGDHVAVMGPSGSGKSTLLHLMAGLDLPSRGEVVWPALGSRDALRPGPVAVVFQGPSLLPPLTVLENVALPLVLAGVDAADADCRAANALELLGLTDVRDKLPEEISGGQAQRAAVARALAGEPARRIADEPPGQRGRAGALAGEPALLIADEPTGQLDRASAHEVVEALLAAASTSGAALVVATHDETVAAELDQRWEIHSGRLAQ